MTIDELIPLSPALFFQVSHDVKKGDDLNLSKCFKGKHLLADLDELMDEDHFADVAAAWSENGLTFAFSVDQAFTKSDYPAFERSDAIEICLDTRNLSEASIIHRYCHHFIVLAASNLETSALEITRFRGEDKHELANPADIQVERQFQSKSYRLKVHFPAHVLNGYEPKQHPTLRFTCRIHRTGGEPQHFNVSSKQYQLMSNPMLWSTLELVK